MKGKKKTDYLLFFPVPLKTGTHRARIPFLRKHESPVLFSFAHTGIPFVRQFEKVNLFPKGGGGETTGTNDIRFVRTERCNASQHLCPITFESFIFEIKFEREEN